MNCSYFAVIMDGQWSILYSFRWCQNVKNKSLGTKEMCISRTKCSKRLDGLRWSMNHVGTVRKTHLCQTLEKRWISQLLWNIKGIRECIGKKKSTFHNSFHHGLYFHYCFYVDNIKNLKKKMILGPSCNKNVLLKKLVWQIRFSLWNHLYQNYKN